jgi:ATP-dependent RNA helicase DDX19/DBP5
MSSIAKDSCLPEKEKEKKTKNETERVKTEYTLAHDEKTTFESLNVNPNVCRNVICELGFTKPSKIQAQSLPIILSSKYPNFIGQSQAGSGKTGAYAMAVLTRMDSSSSSTQAIILLPTRELAVQVHGIFQKIIKGLKITTLLAVPIDRSSSLVEKKSGEMVDFVGKHVVVGTPGTVLNGLKRGLSLKDVRVFVCDEADQMVAQHPFSDQVLQIKNKCSPTVQTLLFSATYPESVSKFATRIAPNAEMIRLKMEEVSLDHVCQFWATVDNEEDKYKKLTLLYSLLTIGQSIIFMDTIKAAKDLCNRMRKDGFAVSLMHGRDLTPTERDAIMRDFVSGKTTVLIATNVVARGIDVPSVNMVINYELPHMRDATKVDLETYAHRIGRAGRFGRLGAAITFAMGEPGKLQIDSIIKYFAKPITQLNFNDLSFESTIKHAINHK